MTQHTPAPWEAKLEFGRSWFIQPRRMTGNDPETICIVHKTKTKMEERGDNQKVYTEVSVKPADANARLIAAAPALLEALEGLVSVVGKMKPAAGEPYGRAVAELCEARAVIKAVKET